MRLLNGSLRLSASDLANHLACRHLTELNRAVSEGRLGWPHFDDSGIEALKERGFEHERQYIEHLRGQGLNVETIEEGAGGVGRTDDAMRRGVDVIVQAVLATGRWFGKADVLRKLDKPSTLGAFSYEPYDTKLAKEAKGAAVLQLCLYCDVLETAQGRLPEFFHIVPPGVGFEPQTFRVRDVISYYRLVKKHLEAEVDGDARAGFRHYPDPVDFCEVCQWGQRCDQQRRKDDHLSLVASITRGQRRELTERNVVKLEALANVPLPLQWKPDRGSVEALTRTAEQARIQSRSRKSGKPLYEFLDVEVERGFYRLPEPSPSDIFFDIEGDPFVGSGGLEYLFGFASASEQPSYEALWAFDAAAEKAIFETFVDRVMATWKRRPGMHVYHYAPYEPSALKRLMGRYGTREGEVDRMLRGDLFVDLFRIVRQSVRVGIESYSIKKLEPLLGFQRDVRLDEAGDARHELELSLEFGDRNDITDDIRKLVEGYNRDDCLSALRLRDWLEEKRTELLRQRKGLSIPRPEPKLGDASESVQTASTVTKAVFDRLLQDVPAETAERSDEQNATWLLAQLLDFHRREDKTISWECRRLAELEDDDLFDERAAIAGLEFVRTVARKKVRTDRYRFPPQDCDLDAETKVYVPDNDWGRLFGTVTAFDPEKGTIDIRKRRDTATEHPKAIYGFTKFPTEDQRAALLRLGTWVADHGLDADGSHRAARDSLLRRPPRMHPPATGPLQEPDEPVVRGACRLVLKLNQGVLAIQGPPGTGKTFTGARVIRALVKAGKKVGVIATGHTVIDNLLKETLRAAKEEEMKLVCGHKREGGDQGDGIITLGSNEQALSAVQTGDIQVLGGTSWMWSRQDFAQSVDVLILDEAGQFSLADALAAAQAAESILLLGDPRQLERPIKGSHPEGAAASALEHLLDKNLTVPKERGLFLGETYRLHPAICQLTSELFYDDRLHSTPGRERQVLAGTQGFDGAGLWYVPVEHEGNQSCAPEEVASVQAVIDRLLVMGATWTDAQGKARPLQPADILIVAPYNAQVNRLARKLPGFEIGTVDRFQGQQAPVIVISMTSSSAEDAPRGMDFLYSPNRFNVATSRAKCACIVVASPLLFEPDCRSPKQMKLANALCRYRELATTQRLLPSPAGGRGGLATPLSPNPTGLGRA